MGTITIEIDEKHALVRHIQSIEEALAKRNATIERLQERLDAGEESPLIQFAYERGKRDGWRGCSNAIAGAVDQATRALASARSDAVHAYTQPERDARQASSDAGGAE